MTLYNSESGDITMVLTGESLISRRMRVFKEERFLRMREIIQGGDVSFTNAEMLFHDYAHSPNPPRTPELGEALKITSQVVGCRKGKAMVIDIPHAILNDRPLSLPFRPSR